AACGKHGILEENDASSCDLLMKPETRLLAVVTKNFSLSLGGLVGGGIAGWRCPTYNLTRLSTEWPGCRLGSLLRSLGEYDITDEAKRKQSSSSVTGRVLTLRHGEGFRATAGY
ncbi:hypothetical protein BaRGS_00004847, partial [Batillaria attramentaria]